MKRRSFLKALLASPLLVPEFKKQLENLPRPVPKDGCRWKIDTTGNLVPNSEASYDLSSSAIRYDEQGDFLYVTEGSSKKKIVLNTF